MLDFARIGLCSGIAGVETAGAELGTFAEGFGSNVRRSGLATHPLDGHSTRNAHAKIPDFG